MIRNTLLANVTTALANTSIGVSSELPWNSGAQPLYEKNMKKLYLDQEEKEITELISTLSSDCDVFQTIVNVTGYLTVDAKNEPTDIGNVINSILYSRRAVTGQFRNECSVTTEIEDDRITYIFEFEFAGILNN